MALFDELIGTDQFDSVEDKLNAVIQFLNDKLSGGTTGQYPAKASSTDFDFALVSPPSYGTGALRDSSLNWVDIPIGDWNMDGTGLIDVTHGLTQSKIRVVTTQIRPDADQTQEFAQIGDGRSGTPAGYIITKASVITLGGISGSFFDSTAYNSTSYNRGWVTIGYTD